MRAGVWVPEQRNTLVVKITEWNVKSVKITRPEKQFGGLNNWVECEVYKKYQAREIVWWLK